MMDDSLQWEVRGFTAKTTQGDLKVAGWVRGRFAIDWRPLVNPDDEEIPGAWVITHLPTGWAAYNVVGGRDDAQAVVDELEALGDWNFTEASQATALKPAVQRWIRNTRYRVMRGDGAVPPHASLGGVVITGNAALNGIQQGTVQ